MKVAACLFAAFALVSPAARAQSLADAAKDAAPSDGRAAPKVYTNKDLPTTSTTPLPTLSLTTAEMAAIDRGAFDQAYSAGKAVRAAQYLSAVGVTPRQFQELLRTFNTALSIVADKATTRGDKVLVGQYQNAALQFELGLLENPIAAKHYGQETMTKATAALDAANKIYLGK